MRYFISFLASVTVLVITANYTHCATNITEHLTKAHALYDKSSYEEAIKAYKQVLPKGGELSSGTLYFNLGNFYFRNEQLGHSIFYYLQAQKHLPRDPDVKFNLEYARGKTIDKLEPVKSWSDFITLSTFLNSKESLYFVSALSLLFWIITVLLILIRRSEWGIWVQKITLFCLLLSIVVAGKDYLQDHKIGVITSEQAKVYSAIGKDNVVLFSLSEGHEFFVTSSVQDKWLQITLRDGKKGWIESKRAVF